MTFQPAVNCASAAIHATYQGQPVANVLNFLYSSAYNQTVLQDLADALDTEVVGNYLPYVANQLAYTEVHVRGLTSENDLEATANAGAGDGSGGAAGLPGNASLCVTLRSGYTGRSARGRFYAFPATQGDLDTPQTFATEYTGLIVAFLDGVKVAAAAAGWSLIILSRFNNKAKRTAAQPFLVTSISARNSDVDSQRGRLAANH